MSARARLRSLQYALRAVYPIYLVFVFVVLPEAFCRLDGKYTAHREAVLRRQKHPFSRSWMDLSVKKAKTDPNTVRIVAVGDSFTHGVTLKLAETWPVVLEGLLNAQAPAAGPRYEVINAGVGGENLIEESLNIKLAVANLEPDLIVHQLFLNDFYLAQKYEECGEFEAINRVLRAPEFRLHLFYYAWSAWRTVRHRNTFYSFIKCQGDPEKPHWARLARYFARNRDLLDEHGVGYVVFLAPQMNWEKKKYPFLEFHESVRRTVSSEVEHYYDLLPRLMEEFESAYDYWLDPYFPDAHPNAEMHHAFAVLALGILHKSGFVTTPN